MTTVINLSLFNLSLDRSSSGGLFFNKRSSTKEREEFHREQVIDVTPQSRVYEDDSDLKNQHQKPLGAERLHNLSIVNVTYDRQARIIEHVNKKGMLFSSYA